MIGQTSARLHVLFLNELKTLTYLAQSSYPHWLPGVDQTTNF